MASSLQHVAPEMSSAPTTGEPWNFNGVLECLLIPKTIAADGNLLPGARLLWGVIRQYSCRDGYCVLADEALAKTVGVVRRQVIRYFHQLERAGLLRTTLRPGKTPIRELLWDSRFASPPPRPVTSKSRGGDLEVTGGGLAGHPYIRNKGSLKVAYSLNAADVKITPSANASAPAQPKPAAEWTEEEYIARGRACGFPKDMIERDLERLRRRKANGKAGRLTKASEMLPELGEIIRQ